MVPRKNVPVTGLEVWEGYWYANQYWGFRKVQITWADDTRAAFGADLRAQRHNALWLDPQGEERITNLTTRIGEIWNNMSITTDKGQSLAAGGAGGNQFSWQRGNGILLGFRGYCWPPDIVQVGPVWAK
jgi:hypothetical protein